MLRQLLGVSLSLGLWAYAPVADACSCSAPGTFVFPMNGQMVPTNSKIIVFDGSQSLTKPSLIKVSVGGKSIAFDAKEFSSKALHGWVLTPKKPLKAGSTVNITAGKSKFSFTTSKDSDSSAPTLSDISATPEKSPAPTGMCSSGNSYVQFELKASTEKIVMKDPPKIGSPSVSEASMVKVWVDESGKSIDFTKEPTFYELSYENKFQLSKSSICAVNNYDLNALAGKKITVGVVLLDLAGNESKPVEKTVAIK